MKTIYVTLRMTPGGIPPVIHLNQYDKGLTQLVFQLSDDAGYYEIPNGVSVYIIGTKPDQTGYQYTCTYSGHTVTVAVQDQMTVCAGRYAAEIRVISSDTGIIGTANFAIAVEQSALSEETAISKTDLPMIEKAIEAYDATKDAVVAAQASEKNAKASEEAAKASETAAASSQSKAATSETKAKASETAAAGSASAASTSETNAKASETSAKASETATAKSESNAAKSETNAKNSETAAAASQSAAATSESNAASSAAAASASQSAAATSEANAKTSETNSASSASAAKTSETNAANSATTASDQATAAAGSASEAKTSETNAKSSATAAKTSETNAAVSAKAAKESEDRCQALAGFTVDDTVNSTSTNAVMSKGIYRFVTDQVSTETSRAKSAEQANANNITANYNTQDGVNTALKNRLTTIENKHTIVEKTVSADAWTAQDDGSIRATVSLTAVYELPMVYNEDSTAQIIDATVDKTVPALYLYASEAPTEDVKVIVKGAE